MSNPTQSQIRKVIADELPGNLCGLFEYNSPFLMLDIIILIACDADALYFVGAYHVLWALIYNPLIYFTFLYIDETSLYGYDEKHLGCIKSPAQGTLFAVIQNIIVLVSYFILRFQLSK